MQGVNQLVVITVNNQTANTSLAYSKPVITGATVSKFDQCDELLLRVLIRASFDTGDDRWCCVNHRSERVRHHGPQLRNLVSNRGFGQRDHRGTTVPVVLIVL